MLSSLSFSGALSDTDSKIIDQTEAAAPKTATPASATPAPAATDAAPKTETTAPATPVTEEPAKK